MNKTLAKEHAHTLSKPSKMPGHAYSVSAKECGIGGKLAKQKGTVCHDCYALKGNYRFKNVQDAQAIRLDKMLNDVLWEDAMVYQILATKERWFRWFDSGDLQTVENLARIVRICERTPNVMHWLPTKEYGIVNAYLNRGGEIPSNLTVRLSAYKMDAPPPQFRSKTWQAMTSLTTSTVSTRHGSEPIWGKSFVGSVCPSSQQNNECRDCRNCCSKEVKNVTYLAH